MPTSLTLWIALILIADGFLLCVGWQLAAILFGLLRRG